MIPVYLLRNKQGHDILHYLRGLSGIDMEPIWQNSHLVALSLVALSHFFMSGAGSTKLDNDLFEWSSVCTAMSFDFNVPDDNTFYHRLVLRFSEWDANSLPISLLTGEIHYRRGENLEPEDFNFALSRLTTGFDSLIRQRIGSSHLTTSFEIPVALAAFQIVNNLRKAQEQSLIASNPTATLCRHYRNYYIDYDLELSLKFLEHVISLGISYRPDCIFDTLYDQTIYDQFWYYDWEDVWEQILEEHGIDPEWAFEEDKRRKRVVLGDSSAHEVRVGVDAAEILQVQRRRVFEADGD
jgi:hypothetical protein